MTTPGYPYLKSMKTLIETKLRETFSPISLIIEDESHLHVTHGNYQSGGGSHLKITLVSPLFTGCSRIQRHQMVYACLAGELKNGVHALCLQLHSKEEVASL